MVEDIAEARAESQADPATYESRREQSTIAFPYGDLDDGIEVARAIAGNYGSQCSTDQLAAKLGHDTVKGGAFRLKLATARTFGLIEVVRDQVALTPLGRQIVQPEFEGRARAEAFMRVPLYAAMYEAYKGNTLPPDIAIENEMKRLGVATKQADKARQAFQRSARQAGFFAHGANRLVMPAGMSATPPLEQPSEQPRQTTGTYRSDSNNSGGGTGGSGGSGGEPPEITNPLLRGLFQLLPPPGANWPPEKRQKWLSTAEGIFDLIYQD
jgi:hypothetical protein